MKPIVVPVYLDSISFWLVDGKKRIVLRWWSRRLEPSPYKNLRLVFLLLLFRYRDVLLVVWRGESRRTQMKNLLFSTTIFLIIILCSSGSGSGSVEAVVFHFEIRPCRGWLAEYGSSHSFRRLHHQFYALFSAFVHKEDRRRVPSHHVISPQEKSVDRWLGKRGGEAKFRRKENERKGRKNSVPMWCFFFFFLFFLCSVWFSGIYVSVCVSCFFLFASSSFFCFFARPHPPPIPLHVGPMPSNFVEEEKRKEWERDRERRSLYSSFLLILVLYCLDSRRKTHTLLLTGSTNFYCFGIQACGAAPEIGIWT